MHTPTAAELLNAWEAGLRQGSIHRALGLLSAAYSDQPAESLAELAIGERDRRLLRLREILFGPHITSTARCPQCSERLEWEMDIADLCVNAKRGPIAELSVESEAYRLKFRLPSSLDLLALAQDTNATTDRRKELLRRCLLEAQNQKGEPQAIEQLPETALQAMAGEMERADPQSNLQMSLACPACGHGWDSVFDIVSFLWAEINHWAERTLRTVHLLARSYGWREADILAMSPTRRQIYVEMAGR